jgi:hypothetical protein
VQQIEYTDTYALIRFLEKVYTNYLEFSRQDSAEWALKVIDFARTWHGESAVDFS